MSKNQEETAQTQKSQLLGLKSVVSLARLTRIGIDRLREMAEKCKTSYPYEAWKEPKRSGQGFRLIENPEPALKRIQEQLNRVFQRLALPRIFHGCYRRTHIKSNAYPHIGSRHYESFDLANYYFNINYKQVYSGFIELGCSPPVARIITQLTTTKGRVPQGAPTSPIIAVIALLDIAGRLSDLCNQIGATLTIYGDNICVSGSPHLRFHTHTMQDIIFQCGFKLRTNKRVSVSYDQPWPLPGVSLHLGELDISLDDFESTKMIFLKCTVAGRAGLARKVCCRFRDKLSGLFYHYQWVGAAESGPTARAESLKRLFLRIKWPSSYHRSACIGKKCLCEI